MDAGAPKPEAIRETPDAPFRQNAPAPTGKVTSFLLRAVLTFPLMRSRLGNVRSSRKSDVARADRASGRCTPAGPRPRRRREEAASYFALKKSGRGGA